MMDETNTAVLFIDVQEKLLPHIDQNKRLEENLKTFLKTFAVLNFPVIVTEQYPKGLGPTHSELKALLNSNSQTYEKTSFSALKDLEIEKKIESLDKDYWIVVGIEAHICILQSVEDLCRLGKSVIVVDECIGSRQLQHKKIALDEMRKKNVRITCTESLLFELLGNANHSKFKEISAFLR
ncbi:MAG: hypothetical protein S4CHLAM6_07310 [Chlamydiae bacterium]|nr:hypothetical protein [Chlamydiota bacterium]